MITRLLLILGLCLSFCGCKPQIEETVVKPTPNPNSVNNKPGDDAPPIGAGGAKIKGPKKQ